MWSYHVWQWLSDCPTMPDSRFRVFLFSCLSRPSRPWSIDWSRPNRHANRSCPCTFPIWSNTNVAAVNACAPCPLPRALSTSNPAESLLPAKWNIFKFLIWELDNFFQILFTSQEFKKFPISRRTRIMSLNVLLRFNSSMPIFKSIKWSAISFRTLQL